MLSKTFKLKPRERNAFVCPLWEGRRSVASGEIETMGKILLVNFRRTKEEEKGKEKKLQGFIEKYTC